ncbi:MAG: archease [Gemmatimonadales bacterium]
MTPHRFLPHTADVAVELRAESEIGLYQAGVDALRELLVGKSPVAPAEERPVPLRGVDPTARLIHFLGDVLYLYDTTRFLPARVSPAGVCGEPLDPTKHDVQREVKAVTHHGALVKRDEAGYRATIIFDV